MSPRIRIHGLLVCISKALEAVDRFKQNPVQAVLSAKIRRISFEAFSALSISGFK
jgi:hypothetical protein